MGVFNPLIYLAVLLASPWLAKKLLRYFSPKYYRMLKHPITAVEIIGWLLVCYPITVIGTKYISHTGVAGVTEATAGLVGSLALGPYVPTQGSGNSPIAYLYRNEKTNQGGLHGIAGWEGVDVATAGPDATIHAPFSGKVELSGCDTYSNVPSFLKVHPVCGTAATRLDLISNDGIWRAMILHGNYSVQAGQNVKQGQPIGTEDCWGWCTGNHTHITLWKSGTVVSYLDYRARPAEQVEVATTQDITGIFDALAGLGYQGVPLRISHYDPQLGGTNCDSDCSTMASGDTTWSWTGGKSGIFAAACPAEWPFGTRFTYGGATYECRDRGGWINCYGPGENDKAIASAQANGHLLSQPVVAQENYCWVDLYNTPPVSYGTMVRDWNFVK